MKKTLLCCTALSIALSCFCQATQKGTELGIGFDAGLPTGNFKNMSNFGIGGTATFAYHFNRLWAISFQTGYVVFAGRHISFADSTGNNATYKLPNLNTMPLKMGARCNLGKGFYAEPQAGFALLSKKGSDGIKRFTSFTYAASVGYAWRRGVNVSLRYERLTAYGGLSFIGVRITYNFFTSELGY